MPNLIEPELASMLIPGVQALYTVITSLISIELATYGPQAVNVTPQTWGCGLCDRCRLQLPLLVATFWKTDQALQAAGVSYSLCLISMAQDPDAIDSALACIIRSVKVRPGRWPDLAEEMVQALEVAWLLEAEREQSLRSCPGAEPCGLCEVCETSLPLIQQGIEPLSALVSQQPPRLPLAHVAKLLNVPYRERIVWPS